MRTVGLGLALPAGAAATLVLTNGSTAANADQLAMALTAEGTASATSAPSDQSKAAAGAALAVDSRSTSAANERVARSAERAADILVAENNAERAAAAQLSTTRTARVVSLLMTPGGAPGSHAWTKPVAGYTLTSGYGMRWGRIHPAQDFALPVGSTVRAMSSGQVVSAEYDGPFGNKVVIEYWDGTVTWYCHLSSYDVKAGDTVNAGEIVARSGNTGHSTGPHLHLEIYPDGGGLSSTGVYGVGSTSPRAWFADKGINI